MNGTQQETLRVALGERSYDIIVASGLIERAGTHIAPLLKRPRAVVITDENVAALYLERFVKSLEAANILTQTITLPAGEQTKSFAHLERLCEQLSELNVERSTTLIALGGGVIGDLVGFAAAVMLRGLAFIQVPTTLLAQVDSSVGGKTGINTRFGKNLVGAFYQPKLVLADVEVLETLEPRQLLAGYAEVVKYAFIDDAPFFAWLEENAPALLQGDRAKRRHAILTSCAAKARVVAQDEREAGKRALLNLGHTFGHALEAQTGYGEALLHGEGVAIGMAMAFALSHQLGLCPGQDATRAVAHMARVGLPTDLSALDTQAWHVDALMDHMSRDKKVEGGKVSFVLLRAIGQAFTTRDVDMASLRDMLERWLETKS